VVYSKYTNDSPQLRRLQDVYHDENCNFRCNEEPVKTKTAASIINYRETTDSSDEKKM
jgi:hypothetical protein